MAKFDIPASPQYSYLDLNDLKGLDTMSTSPNYMRATDMVNLVKKDGVHRIRSSVRQSFQKFPFEVTTNGYQGEEVFNDLDYTIKFFGKVEQLEKGNTIPYYIKITEKLGGKGVLDDSTLTVTLFTEPYMDVVTSVFNPHKIYKFTNYGETGNRNGLYESIEFDGKTWVFTPIGILTFNCWRTLKEGSSTEYDYDFEVINVLDDPYVPLIGIGTYPDGTGYVKYESLNLLSDARRVRFRGDGTSTKFVLPEKNILADGISVHKLNGDELIDMDVEYTVDTEAGTVTFASALPKADGADNVEIRYRKDDVDYTVKDGCYGLYNKGKYYCEYRINKLRDDDNLPNQYCIVDCEITFKPGPGFIEGEDYIDNITYNIYKGDKKLHGVSIVPTEIHSKDFVEHFTTRIYAVPKDLFEDDSKEWKLCLDTVVITHEDVVNVVEGDNGGYVWDGTPTSISAPAIDDTGKDLSWMGVCVSAGGEVLLDTSSTGLPNFEIVTSLKVALSDKSDLVDVVGGLYTKVGDYDWVQNNYVISFDGTRDIYPGQNSSCPAFLKIPYTDELAGTKIPIKWRIKLNTYSEKEGRTIQYVESDTVELEIPKATFPLTPEELEECTTRENIEIPASSIISNVDSIVESHRGKLSCYYFTKACTVYGHESNRRVFVSDGSGTDTFSGECLNNEPSIYYFPDDNYKVLGEDTEILGYAETDGKLLTFKRGDDSVYVRYGATVDKKVQFPALAVTKNLQIFAKPIQIGNEVLVITRDGIKSIVYTEMECRAHLRSYFINSYFPLWKDYEYDKMQWYVEENMLHIFLDKYEFVADLNVKSYVAEGNTPGRNAGTSTLQFQYDWYVCKHRDEFEIPKVVVYQPRDFENAEVSKVPQDLVPIGYSNNAFYRFQWDGPKVDMYIDDVRTLHNAFYPIAAKYVTPFLDFGAINLAKTIKYVYINTRATDNSAYEIGYIDENGYTETMEKIYGEITDQKTRYKNTEVPFPKLIQIKSKIKKFMNIKLYIKNLVDENDGPFGYEDEARYGDMNFDRILIQYQASGKYRGE